MKDDCEAVFLLNCPDGSPELRENYGFKLVQLNKIAAELAACLPDLCRAWQVIHGNFR